MASVLAALGFFAAVGWIAAKRRFLFYVLLFIWIAFSWRLLSSVFIDVGGPLYAVELFREIGGGNSAVVLVGAYLVMIVTVLVVFRPSRARALAQVPVPSREGVAETAARLRRVSEVVFAAYVVLWVFLFGDMIRIGVVPLFSGIERYIYTLEYGGVFHAFVSKYGMHLSFFLGLFCASRSLVSEQPDWRFLVLLLVLFVYLLLVGHRFSAFYSHSTFFLIPFSAVALRRQYGGGLLREPMARGRRLLLPLASVSLIVAMVAFAQYRSLLFTRGLSREVAVANLAHRVFVQQGELWWSTYERVFLREEWDPQRAVDGILLDPIAPERNTTIPFLMEREIGDQVYPLLEIGVVYTGGYPEVMFELFGPVAGFVGTAVMAYVLAKLLYGLLRAISMQRYFRVFLLFYVFYLFILFTGSGMLNSIVSWKFGVKLAALLVWVFYEEAQHLRRGLPEPGQLAAVQV